jgi:hypothetical protein
MDAGLVGFQEGLVLLETQQGLREIPLQLWCCPLTAVDF